MNTTNYTKYPIVYEGTHAVLYDCSKDAPGLAIGVWRGFFQLNKGSFIEEMLKSLDVIKQRKIVALISDHTGLKVVSKDVLAWAQAHWYPTAAQYGLRIEAALDAESAIAQFSLKRMLHDAQTGSAIQTPIFADFQSAYMFCAKFLKEYTHLSPVTA